MVFFIDSLHVQTGNDHTIPLPFAYSLQHYLSPQIFYPF